MVFGLIEPSFVEAIKTLLPMPIRLILQMPENTVGL